MPFICVLVVLLSFSLCSPPSLARQVSSWVSRSRSAPACSSCSTRSTRWRSRSWSTSSRRANSCCTRRSIDSEWSRKGTGPVALQATPPIARANSPLVLFSARLHVVELFQNQPQNLTDSTISSVHVYVCTVERRSRPVEPHRDRTYACCRRISMLIYAFCRVRSRCGLHLIPRARRLLRCPVGTVLANYPQK